MKIFQERIMTKIEEEIRLELKHKTNRCRMELVSIQAQYYVALGIFV